MKKVGEYYLTAIFSPIAGSNEMDWFLGTDVTHEPEARRFIRTVIVPHFEDVEEEAQGLMKESLRYYLTKGFNYQRF